MKDVKYEPYFVSEFTTRFFNLNYATMTTFCIQRVKPLMKENVNIFDEINWGLSLLCTSTCTPSLSSHSRSDEQP